jgi:DNA-binding NarL/FixJ family response regulator
MTHLRVLLADDHALVRAGIRALLDRLSDVQVVAEANDGREALRLIETQPVDIVLMDVAMSGLNGLAATERIAREHPRVRVIMLSMHANEEYVWQALHSGAAGYLLKDASLAELDLALKAVSGGEVYLGPQLAQRLEEYVQRVGTERSLLEQLSLRQREVLQLIAEGHSTLDIARIMQVSAKTVETHRAQVMDRLGIYTVAGLVRYALHSKLSTPD